LRLCQEILKWCPFHYWNAAPLPAQRSDEGTDAGVSDTDEIGRDSLGTAPRYTRRLSDKILIAFHHACDQADFEIADQLLRILEMLIMRRPLTADSNRRRSMESLVAAHERLWHLRHPDQDQT
jgi:hypothetical protein